MIGYLFGSLLHTAMAPFLALWSALDFHFDQSPYVIAFMSYLGTLDNFFPFTDAVIPIALAWQLIANYMIIWQVLLKVYNAIRGAGVR